MELVQILSSPHMRALSDCIREISTQNFYTPTLPSSGLFAIDGTVNNLPQAVYNDSLQVTTSLNRRNNLLTQKSESLGSETAMNGAAKLTGGGDALQMKPVDEGDLRLISFKKNFGEDLVSKSWQKISKWFFSII